MNYPHVVNYFRSHAWAVQESTFGTMLELVAKWERGRKILSDAEVAEQILRRIPARVSTAQK